MNLRSMIRTRLPEIALLASLIPVSTLTAQESPDPLSTITEAELRDHIFYLASDSLEGRDSGSKGYMLAAQYSAIHMHQAGLVPMFTDSSGASTYYQQIQFGSSTINPESTMRVRAGGSEIIYHFGQEFTAQEIFASGGDLVIEGNPVFLGFGIEEPDLGWNDYEGLDVAGKIAIMVSGAPTRDDEPVLPEEKHQIYSSLQRSANILLQPALNHKASTIIVIPDSGTASFWGMITSQMSTPSVRPISGGVPEGGSAPALSMLVLLKPDSAVELFAGTGLNPVTATGTYTPGVLEDVHVSLSMEHSVDVSFSSPNVVGLLAGSDPELKDEYIVVTAHLDHLGVRNGEVFNGADDNASGCAAVLEAAEAAAMTPVKRSIIFVLLTSEEDGLQGSMYFADNPPVPIGSIVLNINLDMVGRNSPDFPEYLLALASENRRPQLVEFITEVNDSGVGARLDMRLNEGEDPHSHVQRSDQLAFMQKGIPAILLTRGFMGPDYHESSDDPETINYDKVLQAARLTFALAVEAANREVLFER